MSDKQVDPSQLSIELLKSVLSTQAAYGRWLVNALWVMHASTIVGLIAAYDKFQRQHPLASLLPFVIGIVLAFVAAFAMWWSFSYAVLEVDTAIKAGGWPDWDKKAMRAYHIAASLGVSSLLCLVSGGFLVLCTWS